VGLPQSGLRVPPMATLPPTMEISDLWFVKLGPDFTGIAEQPDEAMFTFGVPQPNCGNLVHVAGDIPSQEFVRVNFFRAQALSAKLLLSQYLPDQELSAPATAWSFDASALACPACILYGCCPKGNSTHGSSLGNERSPFTLLENPVWPSEYPSPTPVWIAVCPESPVRSTARSWRDAPALLTRSST
jgi:hypothetical protein